MKSVETTRGGSRLPEPEGFHWSPSDSELSPTGEGLPSSPLLSDFDRAFSDDEPAQPTPRPAKDASLCAHALWLHQIGIRVTEDQPRSRHAAKHGLKDKGHRNDAHAIESAWTETPDANVAIRLGSTRAVFDGEVPVYLIALDADGKKANAYVKKALDDAGLLSSTPTITHGNGAKYIMRAPFGTRTARILVPGCRNKGHDGLELLAWGKKATAYGIHPDGLPYAFAVEIPEDICEIPTCPATILELDRKEARRGQSLLHDDLIVKQSGGREWTIAELRDEMIANGEDIVRSLFSPLRKDNKHSCYATLRNGSLRLHDTAEGVVYSDGIYEATTSSKIHPAGPLGGLWGKQIKRSERYLKVQPADWGMDDGSSAELVAIRSPIGSGKTTAIKQMTTDFEDLFRRPARVLYLTYRQSLAKNLAKRLGPNNYLDLNEGGKDTWSKAHDVLDQAP